MPQTVLVVSRAGKETGISDVATAPVVLVRNRRRFMDFGR
jgi:hypothetical protein